MNTIFKVLTLNLFSLCVTCLEAQTIDETWTLSVAGQTVQADADGGFRIPNITVPDLFGPNGPGTRPDFISEEFVRLTGYSAKDGVTKYVYSEPFRINQREPFRLLIADLTFSDTPPPVPVSTIATADPQVLTEIGQTSQITVTATLGNGSLKDVSSINEYTIYRNSNPDIVHVDENGLVTARSEGMAFITAVTEGVTTVIQFDVSPGDPLTEVRGFVVDTSGNPVSDARISMPGLTGETTTDEDGGFSLGSIATIFGFSSVVAEITGDDPRFGAALDLRVVPGGFTDAGIIELKSLCDVIQPCIDSDGDFIPDHLEPALALDPQNPDSDGNGLNDGDEDFNGNGIANRVDLFAGNPVAYTLVNGGNQTGTVSDGIRDRYQFEAEAGQTVYFRVAATGFAPRLEFHAPDGTELVLVESSGASHRERSLGAVIPETGLYTLRVVNQFAGASGSYELRYVNYSQEFVIPEGDEGGALTNGDNHSGEIPDGDVDLWTFEAEVGQTVYLRIATRSYAPSLVVYGPDGMEVGREESTSASHRERSLGLEIGASGTYIVRIASRYWEYSGSYELRYVNYSQEFVIPEGDEGGPLTNGDNHSGEIPDGDVDLWTFEAEAGQTVYLRIATQSYAPSLVVYGPDGTEVGREESTSASHRERSLDWRSFLPGPTS